MPVSRNAHNISSIEKTILTVVEETIAAHHMLRQNDRVLVAVSGGPDYRLLLILPELHISTVWAYKNLNLDLTKKVREPKFRGFEFHETEVTGFREMYFNDFEKPVFSAYPVLAEMKGRLYEAGADYAALSGSGSAIFGVFKNSVQAERARGRLKSTCRVKLARPVTG